MATGRLEKRWHVVCHCGEWDIPNGTRAQAEATLRESGWVQCPMTPGGYTWTCPQCIEQRLRDITIA